MISPYLVNLGMPWTRSYLHFDMFTKTSLTKIWPEIEGQYSIWRDDIEQFIQQHEYVYDTLTVLHDNNK